MLNMEYKIQFTEKCLEDIEDACQYIKEKLKEENAANRLRIKIKDSVKGLSNELAMSFNSLQQPEIAFAGSQELNVNHFIKSDDSNLSEIIKSYIDELGNRNNDDAQVIVKVLYELTDAVNDKELNVDADALNKSNKKKDLERLLRRGK